MILELDSAMVFLEGAAKYKKSDVFMIEYEIRKANRQLRQLATSSVTGFENWTPKMDAEKPKQEPDKDQSKT